MSLIALEIVGALCTTLGVLGGVARFIYTRLDKRFTTLAERQDEQDKDLKAATAGRHELDGRLRMIETKVNSLPTNENMVRMHRDLTNLSTKLAVVEERSSATAAGVRRIEEILLRDRP